MSNSGFLSSLNLTTLMIGLVVACIALALFMRKRSNAHSLDGKRERNVAKDLDEGRAAPDNLPPQN